MSTHNHIEHTSRSLACFRITVFLLVCLGVATTGWHKGAVADPVPLVTDLERFAVASEIAYQTRVVPEANPSRLTFFAISFGQKGTGMGVKEIGFVYGIGGDLRALPIRWTWGETTCFLSHHLNIPTMHPVNLSSHSVSELVCRAFSDNVDTECAVRYHGRSSGYCSITPAKEALTGFMSLTDEGFERTMPPAPHVVQYDIRAVNDTVIELFMTVDQRLTKWVYDGKQWKHLRNYPIEIKGEFLVCQDGRSLVTERDGNWSVVEFEAAEPIFKAITERVPDQPLTLVEDTVEKQTYFEHRGDVFDKAGVKVWAAPSGLKRNDRAQALVDFVRTRRSK